MPIDNRVIQRYRLLDKLFREQEGNTYEDLIYRLEEKGIEVSERTIKADKKYFEEKYGAVFARGKRKGKQAIVRYEDIHRSVFSETLSDEEKDIIARLSEKLQIHDDIPQYQWILFLLNSLAYIDGIEDLEDYLMFDNNLNLEGVDNFNPIMEACVGKYAISLQYAPFRHADSPRTYTVSPYLLKQFNNRWFLICQGVGYSTLSTFALDRIVTGSVKRAEGCRFSEPKNRYSIGNCLYQSVGITSVFSPEKRKNVILKVSKERSPYILTKPIIPNQQVLKERGPEGECFIRLEAITINKELESLILSFGTDVEVIEPSDLREQIRAVVSKTYHLYSATPVKRAEDLHT